MIPLTLADIAAATGGTLHNVTDPATVVDGPLSFDSRDVVARGLFACLRGRTLDGHVFAEQAVRDGAAAVLATHPVEAPAVIVPSVLDAMGHIAHAVADKYTGTVIALTGSAGKTSTKDILESVLSLDGPTVATAKSFNNEIGLPVTVRRVMPDSRYLVLEMGARGKGHIKSLCTMVRPAIATVLGIGSAHVGEFGSRQAVAEAKAEIVRALPEHGVAVLYGDDPLVRTMATATPARVLTFGTGDDCDVRAETISVNQGRPHVTLLYGQHREYVELQCVYGRHNVTNALAAAATAIAARVPFQRIVRGLSTATLSSGGRMEILNRADGVTIINDAFNASPESVIAALDALADIAGPERRRIAVLGEMAELGQDAEEWHDTVAKKVLDTGVHLMVGVGGPHAQSMITTIRDGGVHAAEADTALPLAQHINDQLQPCDVVLVKGANALGLETAARELAELRTP
ncbi:UDP-N-acetylmuramoyl-tripeptide--D-alanyl-D-alanine ligase [Streptomyces sp. NPDC002730]|uniref:UDP-N-acetylmuramoyl-tripeptide--D-alanyl-D- alanine ligase n=1 Tax=Streptomyces sp. NPDC002730 TaxID=3364662 RepID=UPI0036B8A6BF